MQRSGNPDGNFGTCDNPGESSGSVDVIHETEYFLCGCRLSDLLYKLL